MVQSENSLVTVKTDHNGRKIITLRSKRDLLVTITEKINMFGQKIITLGGRDGETSENSRGF